MNESTARAERFDLQNASSPLYLWEVPQKPVSVRIPFSLIDRLERDAVESFRSLTSRGSEIGGLLVGEVSPGSPLVVSIADYDLIACDYSRGPLYRLSDADMGRFEQAIQQRLASGRGIAGFFRSHTRKGISLDADDLTFFQARFRDPHHIALLVRPFATKASTAGIFIWENGKVNGDASCLEFPFRSSELGTGQTTEPAAAKPAAPAPAPPPTKPAPRAQIVPIASRREISIPAVPVAEPAPLPAPVAASPAPAAIVAPPAPPVEEKTAIVPPKTEKPGKNDKYEKNDKFDKSDKSDKNDKLDKSDKSDKNEKAAKVEKSTKVETPAPKTAPTPAKIEKTEKTEKKEALPAIAAAETVAPAARSGKGMKLIVATAATLALFVILFVYPGVFRSSSKHPAPVKQDSSQLQLRVERAAGELLLTWNRDSDAIRNASKGVLSITDGDQHENVEMDVAQLNNGSIVYSPSGTDISFKMEVVDKSQKTTTSESVRMLRTHPSPLQEQNDAAAAKAAAAAPGTKPAPGATTPAAATPTPNADPVADAPAKPAAAPLKAFRSEPLAQRLRPAAPTDMPDAPTVNAGDRPTTSAIPGVSVGAVAPAPYLPAAPAPPTSTPSTASSTDSKPKSGGQIQQAVLIYRKDAEYPKIAKQTGAKGTVTLNATIGTDGLVKKVKVISGHPMLTNAAIDAVKQWKYRPTLLNGQPVETETQVLINFVGDR
jgi:periplasmic protein TonB